MERMNEVNISPFGDNVDYQERLNGYLTNCYKLIKKKVKKKK